MCGIAALLCHSSQANAGRTAAALDQAPGPPRPRHAGHWHENGTPPGFTGAWQSRTLTRRPPADGRPPAAATWLVFNGEDLQPARAAGDLERQGHRFRSGGDTSAAAACSSRYGSAAWGRLRGNVRLLPVVGTQGTHGTGWPSIPTASSRF